MWCFQVHQVHGRGHYVHHGCVHYDHVHVDDHVHYVHHDHVHHDHVHLLWSTSIEMEA